MLIIAASRCSDDDGGAQSDAEMVMWLEDDAVLLPNWREATLNASTYCLTALHPCNCHSCKQE
eukprot:2459696-Rhodomonas_salina.1